MRVRKKLKNRVFVTSFASNVARLETIAAAAKESGRSLVVLGRSMHRMISVARQNGILKDIDVICDLLYTSYRINILKLFKVSFIYSKL